MGMRGARHILAVLYTASRHSAVLCTASPSPIMFQI